MCNLHVYWGMNHRRHEGRPYWTCIGGCGGASVLWNKVFMNRGDPPAPTAIIGSGLTLAWVGGPQPPESPVPPLAPDRRSGGTLGMELHVISVTVTSNPVSESSHSAFTFWVSGEKFNSLKATLPYPTTVEVRSSFPCTRLWSTRFFFVCIVQWNRLE